MERAAYITGKSFAKYILPSYQTVLRHYFGRGDVFLRKTSELVKFRNWEKAEKKWKEDLPSASSKNKARLLYNLSLVEEMKGNRKKALQYMEEAVSFYPSEDIQAYRNLLKQETKEKTKTPIPH